MVEWSITVVLKTTVLRGTGGSNPSLSAKHFEVPCESSICKGFCFICGMALIKSYKGLSPKWGKDCYFSENATIVGDVTMGDQCSVWFNAVVRGDVAPITIGDRTNVQDGSCVHVTHDTGPTHIGSDVTIGHNVTVHACTIHDGALIGMGSTLLDGCEIGEGAIVAAGALVLQNTKIPPHEIWGGVPAKYLKPTRPGQTDNAAHYVEYAKEYLKE